jgi:spore maturation protein CgeB
MNKLVMIVGVLDNKSSTNVSMARAFMNFGFKVVPVNYRTLISQYGHKAFEKLMIDAIKKHKPYLVIFCKCNGVNPNLTKECTKLTKTWLWNPDPYQTIDQCPEVIEHMKNCTFCSHTGGGVHEYYVRRYNLSNSHHIFCGLDFIQYKPTDAVAEYKADISFIGNETPLRNRFKEVLESTGLNVKFYGQGYIKPVYNEKFSQVCSSSDMMLSLNTYNDIPDYFSNRLLRYIGCGACALHYDPTETLHKYFENEKEILLFRDEKRLLGIIRTYRYFDNNGGKIAFNGREKALRNYTWEHTAGRILEITK